MAIICNGRIGIYANELIIENPSRKIGSKHGFLPEGTYQTMVRRKQLFLLQNGSRAKPAIIDYDTMRDDVKNNMLQRMAILALILLLNYAGMYWRTPLFIAPMRLSIIQILIVTMRIRNCLPPRSMNIP